MPSEASNAGIVTDANSGQRHIPESLRSDGSTRKAINIRPGYRPPEDVEVYKNRTAKAFHDRGQRIGIPGAAATESEKLDQPSATANKNAKRREARKKAKSTSEEDGTAKGDTAKDEPDHNEISKTQAVTPVNSTDVDQVEGEKKARTIKKKLKQAKELKNKKDDGETLLPEQIAKVIKINELIRELDALGFDADGEPKSKGSEDQKQNEEEP